MPKTFLTHKFIPAGRGFFTAQGILSRPSQVSFHQEQSVDSEGYFVSFVFWPRKKCPMVVDLKSGNLA
jgi:hypothetical protein